MVKYSKGRYQIILYQVGVTRLTVREQVGRTKFEPEGGIRRYRFITSYIPCTEDSFKELRKLNQADLKALVKSWERRYPRIRVKK